MDFKKYAEALGLEEDEFIELAELFLDTCIGDLEKLDAAVTTGNTQEAAKAAHSIKGAAGNLGFLELSDIARVIERNAGEGSLQCAPENITALKGRLRELETLVRGV